MRQGENYRAVIDRLPLIPGCKPWVRGVLRKVTHGCAEDFTSAYLSACVSEYGTNHGSALTGAAERFSVLSMELGDVAGDVLSVADDVAALRNTLQVQVSVAPISADEINDVNNAPVSLFVQVTQNGHGVIGLTADSFVFANSFPDSVPVICGTPDCFMPGASGMYMIKVAGDWIAGPYAGTLVAEDGSTTATGTSLVTFEIPAEPAP